MPFRLFLEMEAISIKAATFVRSWIFLGNCLARPGQTQILDRLKITFYFKRRKSKIMETVKDNYLYGFLCQWNIFAIWHSDKNTHQPKICHFLCFFGNHVAVRFLASEIFIYNICPSAISCERVLGAKHRARLISNVNSLLCVCDFILQPGWER